MRYLKLFENKTLDDILDKINKEGMSSLTDLEKDFLDKFSSGDHKDVERQIKNKKDTNKGILAYDPRTDDPDFYKEVGKEFGLEDMSFKNWSDKEIEDGKFKCSFLKLECEMDDPDIKIWNREKECNVNVYMNIITPEYYFDLK